METKKIATNDLPSLQTKQKVKRKKTLQRKKDMFLLLLALPMILYKFIFSYLPMSGIILAFKKFRYDMGIFGSPWAGFENFRYFFSSPDAWRTARNTLGYSAVFIITGTLGALFIALILYEVNNKTLSKYYQTTMLLPHFMSWVVVAFIAYGFLNYQSGILNQFLVKLGLEKVNWYMEQAPWIFIIPAASLWKGIGNSALLYYASLVGIDPEYAEAAKVEGASRWQIATRINLPFLYPLVIMLSVLSIGSIFNADFGLFYQLPKGSPMLLETTDVIETYVFRALREQGNIGMSTAVDLYKSVIGLILVVGTNQVVKKLSPENTLF